MKASGIQMSPYSFDFDSHIAYDDLFEDIVQKFLASSLDHVKDSERIILLDDGGHLINAALKLYPEDCKHIVAVEQTTSGYERLKNSSPDLPIINVAKSKAKLMYEPGFAAGLIIDRTLQKLTRAPRSILIIGKGAIGAAIHARLSNDYEVQFWDIKEGGVSLEDILPKVDLIFGCTGNVSISHLQHPLLKPGCALSSASSSDREFDSVYLRRQFPVSSDCHADLKNDRFQLLNSGFPVNFNGGVHSIPPGQIRLIRALMTMGTLQAASLTEKKGGLIDLDESHEIALIKKFGKTCAM